ncbi:MAG: TAXI family TRAP transporter solute-binding subunit [Spirochaetaceae bacterium]|jgi:TRAP transporter TAXI family solute receptor|nr:TAXI family TRAP transporter solute-binding subunit [Spirochaetaceae bacterium]
MMKKILAAFVLAALVAGSVFANGQAASGGAKETLRFATGGTTGTYYAFGTVLGQLFQEKDGLNVTIQSSGASKANIQLIAAGEAEMALVQNDVMDYAYKGTDLFSADGAITGFQAMAGVYAEVCQVVAGANSGINTIADLKGKRVSVGDAGSGVEFNARQILEAYGVTFDDIQKQNLSFGASADALRDNKIDAFFCVAGAPTPAIVDLALGRSIILLPVDDAHVQALQAKYPFYQKFPIAANSYTGQTADVQTVAVKATIIVSPKVSEDAVYKMTKTLIETGKAIEHPKAAEISPENAVGSISVPFHSGAMKYYKEIGAM